MKLPTNFEEFLNEGASKKKVDANVIADRMMDANLGGHYLLRRYAEEVRALKRVSEYDVDQIVPDHLPGHLIYGLFKESLNEANDIDVYFATGKYKNGDDFHTTDEDLDTLKDEIADFGKELDQKSIKYYVRYNNGKEKLLKESLNESGPTKGYIAVYRVMGQDFTLGPLATNNKKEVNDMLSKSIRGGYRLMDIVPAKDFNGVKKYGGLMLDEAKEIELGGIKAERLTAAGVKGWKITVDSAKGRGTQVIMIPDSIGKELFQFLHKNT